MQNKIRIVIRCNAGTRFGLGHLSRCITLSQVFPVRTISLIVKTDNPTLVKSFISNSGINCNLKLLPLNTTITEEFETLKSELAQNDSNEVNVLFLDHYEVDEAYQQFLISIDVKWLQFDSHAKINQYANWVLHGSSAATEAMYRPLVRNSYSKLLVGANYAIIKPEVRALRCKASTREKLNQILICFGGGNDYGATLKVLETLSLELVVNIKIKVSVKGSSSYLHAIKQKARTFPNFELLDHNDLARTMLTSDLCITAPGMISYEAACLGLPMLLISTADNQKINARGWQQNGCAEYLGPVDSLNESALQSQILDLSKNESTLAEYSKNCFNCIDGNGVFRVKDIILGDI